MSDCSCQDQPHVLRGNEHNLPTDTLEMLSERDEGWGLLYRCRSCGQLWHVDRADRLQVDLCFRIEDLENWTDLDDDAMRIGYLIKSRGGSGDGICKWKGCDGSVLRTLAYCAHHAYHEMGIRE